MDSCTALAGLNEVMDRADRCSLTYEYRHPLSPRSLAGYFHSRSPRPLIVAWLANDRRFDELVSEYRELARKEGRSKSEEALEKLLAYLREFVRPEHEG